MSISNFDANYHAPAATHRHVCGRPFLIWEWNPTWGLQWVDKGISEHEGLTWVSNIHYREALRDECPGCSTPIRDHEMTRIEATLF